MVIIYNLFFFLFYLIFNMKYVLLHKNSFKVLNKLKILLKIPRNTFLLKRIITIIK